MLFKLKILVVSAFLSGIANLVLLAGRPSKFTSKQPNSIEAVLAHYDEDLSWISTATESNPAIRFTVYSKSSTPPTNSIKLPNVGRESHTFLYHIVENYHSLADWTVFSQAAAPSFGFSPNDSGSGHMCSGVTWGSYVNPFPNGEDFFMVHTVATRFPEVWHTDRFDMMFRIPDSKGSICPLDQDDYWSMWWHSADHPLITMQNKTKYDFLPAMDFYNTLIADGVDKTYDSVTLTFANGGRFAASRERIHKRPRQYYESLLAALSKDVNPIEGYYLETMWYDVFHPEHLQAESGTVCNVRPLPTNQAVEHPVMFKVAQSKLDDYLATLDHTDTRKLQIETSDPYLDTTVRRRRRS
mmetsp:Transcript_49200/g.73344  ORF Transcript_49200/g.73344 Transcript_49200/m.73344 type:complete len:355 (-) Transcript_49200:196-1260(-)